MSNSKVVVAAGHFAAAAVVAAVALSVESAAAPGTGTDTLGTVWVTDGLPAAGQQVPTLAGSGVSSGRSDWSSRPRNRRCRRPRPGSFRYHCRLHFRFHFRFLVGGDNSSLQLS